MTGLNGELRFSKVEKNLLEELCDGAVAGLQMLAGHPVW